MTNRNIFVIIIAAFLVILGLKLLFYNTAHRAALKLSVDTGPEY